MINDSLINIYLDDSNSASPATIVNIGYINIAGHLLY